MNQQQIVAYVERLRKSRTFEDAALSMLREMLNVAKEALSKSPFASRGKVLRGMAHLRPGDGYRRLMVLDDGPAGGDMSISYLPSANVWRWIATQQTSIAVDVPLGRVWTWVKDAPQVLFESAFAGEETVNRLRSRDTSHLYAIPLRSFQGAVDGMATVELNCVHALGDDFLFPAVHEALLLCADLAAPYLSSLPLRPTTAGATDDLLPVIGESMAGLVEMLRVFAAQEETLLIGGPTGAGKSRIARWCHSKSLRRGGPFEVLDLIAVPEDLQMAELFGWKKGAFTGAVRDMPGAVTRAFKGTLFIDEIDKLSLKAQAGLLKLLESRTYRPIGDGAREQQADVRFIIGSNMDLHECVKLGRFREDLYYRINVLPMKIPALDERRDEVPGWVRFMALRRHRESVPGGELRLTAAVERVLAEHTWPGNLRQLDNVVRRAYALALMTHGQTGSEIVLDERHFERALSYEKSSSRRTTLDALRSAASAIVGEAERLEEKGEVFDLDLCDAFRGMVLGTAAQNLGSREAAFRLFGKGAQVQSRNHHKLLRRELEKVDALCKALGEEGGVFKGVAGDEG
ncbi:MAG TPA: sigma 54-interacting transcriptional regulator [Polyangium sp.]|nr:sigma 54-interacting transcriptional regulator [Polyangium sp.]